MTETENRQCNVCLKTLPLTSDNFYARGGSRPGFERQCKSCAKERNRAWVQRSDVRKARAIKRRERYEAYEKAQRDPAKSAAIAARWRERHPDRAKRSMQRADARRSADPVQCLHKRMRCAIRKALVASKDGRGWQDIVGFTRDELHRHLERQFSEGMTWERFKAGEIHIDHIRPRSSFPTTPEGFLECWALTNLQPLWAAQNLKKHAKRLYLI